MAVTRAVAGVVYTPRDVCEPMVRLALAPLLGRDDLLSLRVCDPAIGEGAFLIEIVRVIGEALVARGTPPAMARKLVAEHCLRGVDVDPRAVATARAAVEEFVGARIPALGDHLRIGDALAFHWQEQFDLVVGNPPYVRQELLVNKSALRTFEAYDGVADLYVYFIELAQRIARSYCLIVPNKWMTAAYGRPLRERLARSGSVAGVVDFARGLPLFSDADAFPCILWGSASEDRGEPIRASRITQPTSVADALAAPGIAHARERWGADPWHIDDPDDGALIDRLIARWPALAQVIPERPSRGVVTGYNRAFVIDAETRDDLVRAEPAADALIRPFIKGRDVRRWRPGRIDRYILLVDRGTEIAKLPRLRAHLAQFRAELEPGSGRKPGRYKWYELQDPVVPLAKSRAPRLFYQDIQTAPACCLDPTGELVPDTTVWILPSADPFLLAVLNSPLYAWYARRRFPPALNGAVRPKLEYMRALPIAAPSPALHAKIAELVARQLAHADPHVDAQLADLVNEAYELRPDELARLRGR
ncbi:MAG TPA: Eco57I restriction-modification methylase domain-containing protein [Kofleriaceae bacterium]